MGERDRYAAGVNTLLAIAPPISTLQSEARNLYRCGLPKV